MRKLKNQLVFFILIAAMNIIPTAYAKGVNEDHLVDKNVEELVKLGKKAVPGLIRLLKSKISIDRAKAAKALGQIKDKRAVSPLVGALNDESALVRQNALKSLKNITGEDIGDNQEKWIEWLENYQMMQAPAPPAPPEPKKATMPPDTKPGGEKTE